MLRCTLNFVLVVFFSYITDASRDPASNQLIDYSKQHKSLHYIETGYGVHVPDLTSSLTAGPRGPLLLQDVVFLDDLANFARERIPDRVVHAKGSGAYGYFEVTNDITKYSKAKIFQSVGNRTKIAVRFSLAILDRGSAETIRDMRGFAIKFYTEEGIWDLTAYNVPVFFYSEPLLFRSGAHAGERNPVTNIRDPDMRFDFFSLRPETAYSVMLLYSDDCIPDGYRYMNGFGQHAFKMVNANNEVVYVKFHILSGQGLRNLSPEKAAKLSAMDPDYATRDLYNAIARGDYPSWTLKIQVMTLEEAEKFRWNPFDITKIWPEDDFPLIEVGKIILNENPKNYFADVEQIAFNPAHMVPGIEPSPDKLLQARLLVYGDTQRYRLGPNHIQLPVNCPFKHGVTNYQRDGLMTIENQGGAPNYYPNSYGGPVNDPRSSIRSFKVTADVMRYNTSDDNFSQPAMYWKSLSIEQQDHIVENMVEGLQEVLPFIQKRTISMFSQVNETFGQKLEQGLKATSRNRHY